MMAAMSVAHMLFVMGATAMVNDIKTESNDVSAQMQLGIGNKGVMELPENKKPSFVTWTGETFGNNNGTYTAPFVCLSSYVEQLFAFTQGTYGIIDLEVVCNNGETHRFTNNNRGHVGRSPSYNPAKNPIQALRGFEIPWHGVVQTGVYFRPPQDTVLGLFDVAYFAGNGEGDTLGGDMLVCPPDQVMGGMNVRNQPYFGIVNFRVACIPTVSNIDACLTPLLVAYGGSDGSATYSESVTLGYTSTHGDSNSFSKTTKNTESVSTGFNFFFTQDKFTYDHSSVVVQAFKTTLSQSFSETITITQSYECGYDKPCFVYQPVFYLTYLDGSTGSIQGTPVQVDKAANTSCMTIPINAELE